MKYLFYGVLITAIIIGLGSLILDVDTGSGFYRWLSRTMEEDKIRLGIQTSIGQEKARDMFELMKEMSRSRAGLLQQKADYISKYYALQKEQSQRMRDLMDEYAAAVKGLNEKSLRQELQIDDVGIGAKDVKSVWDELNSFYQNGHSRHAREVIDKMKELQSDLSTAHSGIDESLLTDSAKNLDKLTRLEAQQEKLLQDIKDQQERMLQVTDGLKERVTASQDKARDVMAAQRDRASQTSQQIADQQERMQNYLEAQRDRLERQNSRR